MNVSCLFGGLLTAGLLAASPAAAIVNADGCVARCPGVCCPPAECCVVECEETEDGCRAVVDFCCEGEDGVCEVCRVLCEEVGGACTVVSCESGCEETCEGKAVPACAAACTAGSACANGAGAGCASTSTSAPALSVSGPFGTLLAFLSAGARPLIDAPAQPYSRSITPCQSATLLH